MPKRQVSTRIGGVNYRLTQLGGFTVDELGDRITEATALTGRGVPALGNAMGMVRAALIDSCIVEIVDEEDPQKKTRWRPLREVYDDHFAGVRAKDQGTWFAWAVKESGLPAFLGGALKALVPSLLAKLPSAFQPDASGSPTDSSSAND